MKKKRLLFRPLTTQEILAWADAYRENTGKWPTRSSGPIPSTKFESWGKVDRALRLGHRGLPGGSSLALLLAEERGVRHIQRLPPLTIQKILEWADYHFQQTGKWPTADSGNVLKAEKEKWQAIDGALAHGARGLPGGSSLPRLLAEHRGVHNRKQLPHLSEEQILAWADAHHQRTGFWPTSKSGPIIDAPGKTWMAAQVALRNGQRGFPAVPR